MKTVGYISKAVMALVIIIGVALGVMSAGEGDSGAMAEGSATGLSITWTLIILGVGVVGAILSALAGVLGDKKAMINTLIAVVIGAAIVFGAWSLSDSTPLVLPGYEGSENVYPWLNIADTGIFLFYAAAGVAVLSIIGSEIYQMFK